MHLDFLLSAVYDSMTLHAEHLADLRKSGLTDETIAGQKIRTVPPHMIDQLLGFPALSVRSAYIIPFADPRGGWFDHVRLKIFPTFQDLHGRTVRYLGPRGVPPRVFFPASMVAAVGGHEPLWCVEGAKKALAVAQLGLAAVGFEGIEGWHVRGSSALLPDFDVIALKGRVVELVPDGDVATNPNVHRGAQRLAEALERRGACVGLVALPAEVSA